MKTRWPFALIVVMFSLYFYAPAQCQQEQYDQQEQEDEGFVLYDPAYINAPAEFEGEGFANGSIEEDLASIDAEILVTPLVADILATLVVPEPVLPLCWQAEMVVDYYDWYYANFSPIVFPTFIYDPVVVCWGRPIVYSGFWWRGPGWYGHRGFYAGPRGYHAHRFGGYHGFYGHGHHRFGGGYSPFGSRFHARGLGHFRGGSHHPITQRRIATNKIGYRHRMDVSKHGGFPRNTFSHHDVKGINHDSRGSMAHNAKNRGLHSNKGPHNTPLQSRHSENKSGIRPPNEARGKSLINQKNSLTSHSNKGIDRRTSLNQPLGKQGAGAGMPRQNLGQQGFNAGQGKHTLNNQNGIKDGNHMGNGGQSRSTLNHGLGQGGFNGQTGNMSRQGQFGNRGSGNFSGQGQSGTMGKMQKNSFQPRNFQGGMGGGQHRLQVPQGNRPMMGGGGRAPAAAPRMAAPQPRPAPAPRVAAPPPQQQKRR